jgi:hypothetical protein
VNTNRESGFFCDPAIAKSLDLYGFIIDGTPEILFTFFLLVWVNPDQRSKRSLGDSTLPTGSFLIILIGLVGYSLELIPLINFSIPSMISGAFSCAYAANWAFATLHFSSVRPDWFIVVVSASFITLTGTIDRIHTRRGCQ